MKTHVLIVSRVFPSTHRRKGQPTFFVPKIKTALGIEPLPEESEKLHTIRANYDLWAKRIKEVQEGKAILSIRYWVTPGGCYVKNNSQVEICQLDKDSGIGVQKLTEGIIEQFAIDKGSHCFEVPTEEIAKNDGLSFDDFK